MLLDIQKSSSVEPIKIDFLLPHISNDTIFVKHWFIEYRCFLFFGFLTIIISGKIEFNLLTFRCLFSNCFPK